MSECGLKDTNRVWKASMVVCFIGLVLYIVGFSTEYWATLDDERYDALPGLIVDGHSGLWRECTTVTSAATGMEIRHNCQRMDNDDAYKPASKALCSIGLIVITFGIATSILAGWYTHERMMALGGFVILFGALVAAVGTATYMGKAKDEEPKLQPGYSAYLAIFGCAITIIGGGIELVSIKSGYSTIND